MPTRTVKENGVISANIILYFIFQSLIVASIFPAALKLADITPVF